MQARRLSIAVVAVLLVLLLIAAGGCWNRREIETLGFITAVGIDRGEEERIMLTVHIAKPFALAAEAGVTPRERPFWVVSSTGHTTFDAVRKLLIQTPRRPFWAHNEFILIGEELARGGVQETLDFFNRDGETRRRAQIVVAKGAQASDLLQVEFEQERMPAQGGAGILQGAQRGLSAVAQTNLNDFLQMLEGDGIEPVATRAEIVPRPNDKFNIKGNLVRDEVGATARITGAAVFKGDRLVGWLNQPETRGLLWIKDQVNSTIIVIKQPGHEDDFIGLELMQARGGFSPEVDEGGRLSYTVEVEAQAVLGDAQRFIDPFAWPEVWEVMERRMATVIENEIMATVARAQELNSDIFGFGAALKRTDTALWQQEKDRWDETFPYLDVQVEVKADILRSGLTIRSHRLKN